MASDDASRASARALRLDLLRELPDDVAGAWLGRDRVSGASLEVRTLRLSDVDGAGAAAADAAVARVDRLAAALADVDDPRLLRPVAAWTEGDGTVTVASAHAPGVALRDALRGAGGLYAGRAAVILADVARALAAAHQRGVTHGDVRPEHVRLADDGSGVARLGGFERYAVLGDAGLAEQSPPAYQSPEQLDGRAPDARADVHALGVLGWELLTGRRPWSGEPLASVVEKQRVDALPSLAVLCPDAPRGLVAALERALLKEPSRRWPDAAALGDAIERVRGFERRAPSTAPVPPAEEPAEDPAPAPVAAAAIEPVPATPVGPSAPGPRPADAPRPPRAGIAPRLAREPARPNPERRRLVLLAVGVAAVLTAAAVAVQTQRERTRRDAYYLDSLQRGVATGELFDTAPAPDTAPPRVVRRVRPRPVVVAPPPESLVTPALAPAAAPVAPPPPDPESELPPLPAEPPRARVRLPGDSARPDSAPPAVAPAPPPETPPPPP